MLRANCTNGAKGNSDAEKETIGNIGGKILKTGNNFETFHSTDPL